VTRVRSQRHSKKKKVHYSTSCDITRAGDSKFACKHVHTKRALRIKILTEKVYLIATILKPSYVQVATYSEVLTDKLIIVKIVKKLCAVCETRISVVVFRSSGFGPYTGLQEFDPHSQILFPYNLCYCCTAICFFIQSTFLVYLIEQGLLCDRNYGFSSASPCCTCGQIGNATNFPPSTFHYTLLV
jgi:hypothetical protein